MLIGDRHSKNSRVSSGVIQGSQIGPLPFIVFVNDIVDLVEHPARCKLFADDVKLYSRIEYVFRNPVSLTLQTIQQWSNSW